MRESMNEREIGRFTFREALFRRRGLPPHEAEALADRLVERDRDHDDRWMCIECDGHRPTYRCAAGGFPMVGVLQRCGLFTWMTP